MIRLLKDLHEKGRNERTQESKSTEKQTLVAGDHVPNLLEDVSQACSPCNFGVLLSCSQSARADRARSLQG